MNQTSGIGFNLASRQTSTLDRLTSDGAEALGSPEELIAMALAGCFSMSLSQVLEQLGFAPERIETSAEVTLGSGEDRVAITSIRLECVARVADIDAARFQELAHLTKKDCVVSRALAAISVELIATLCRPREGQEAKISGLSA
jgi:osmotically inducible protein OsmC